MKDQPKVSWGLHSNMQRIAKPRVNPLLYSHELATVQPPEQNLLKKGGRCILVDQLNAGNSPQKYLVGIFNHI